jgi:hypothetical protein
LKREHLPQEALDQLAAVDSLGHDAQRLVADAKAQLAEIRRAADREHQQLAEARAALEAIASMHVSGAEYIADAWADYEAAITRAQAEQLRIKSRRAPKSATAVRERGKEMRRLRREAKLNQWIIRLYEHHFPWLTELRDPDEEAAYLAGPTGEAADQDNQDPVRHWLSAQEYAALSPAERNQLSLDRYSGSRKSPWELGRDYERYIGYLREQAGGKVTYKCNIARDGERIYHLPFDQQYDRTVIEADRGKCYASTVADAERAGFRRAWRWHGHADVAS